MQRRRITYVWTGLGVLLLTLAALALRPWNAQAAYPAADAAAQANWTSLNGVPLRGEWWLSQPVHFNPATKVSYKLEAQFAGAAENENLGFMVYLKAQANTANTITDWNTKGEYVLNALETVAQATQPRVMDEISRQQTLDNLTGKVTPFTIINAIFVRGNMEAGRSLGRLNDVAYIEADHRYFLMDNDQTASTAASIAAQVADQNAPDAIELGVNTVHAPQVWAQGFKGNGIVVGSIDTGVDFEHPALNRQYRGNLGGGNYDHNYNWWDTREDAPRQNVPYDDDGHGSHTTGTVLGEDASQTNQIGVAPEAKWMAAKVFPNGGSSGNEEITPAEDFMLAPWDLNGENRRPDLRPHVINNSWGDGECWNTDSWLITQAWIDAGIMPSFSNGNSGPAPGTVGSPGSYPFLMGVGALNASNLTIAGFSSRGPSCYGGVLKPDISAPGVNVRSSFPGNSYGSISGTSMASPHVAGVMALILDANPSLTFTDVTGIITRTAYWQGSFGTRPNNNYGWGLVQADTAVEMALHGPRVSGTVTGNGPVDNARVTARRTDDNDTYSVLTRNSGTFSMTVLAGTYDVEVSAFGYDTATLTGQVWLTDTSPVVNVTLTPADTFALSGQFLLNGACTPLDGTLMIEAPGAPTITTDIDGYYSVNVPAGTYTVTADAGPGYQMIVEQINVGAAMTHNFTFGPAHDSVYVVDMPAATWIPATDILAVSDGEDGYGTATMPFALDFYTGTYTSMLVSTNGYITFKDMNYARMWANTGIPNPGPVSDAVTYRYPNNAIYPYWDDLSVDPRTFGDIYTGVSGSAPNRIFVVEWRGVGGTDAPMTFQVQLEETTNRITFVYQNIETPYGGGYSATVGIEDDNGINAIQLGFNQPGRFSDNMAFRFTEGSAPTIEPCAGATATVPVGSPTVEPSVTPTVCTLQFTDVEPGSTFYENIMCLACRGIINGYTTGCETGNPCFRPGNLVTRGQLAKIVANAAGFVEPVGSQQFEDVPVGSTFFEFVWRLADREIVTGYPCGGVGEPCGDPALPYFRPNNNVTRGQISKIVSEAAGLSQTPTGQQFQDVPEGSTFYVWIWRLVDEGVMNGYPCGGLGEPCGDPALPYFRPGANATRGQASKIVANTFFPECSPAR